MKLQRILLTGALLAAGLASSARADSTAPGYQIASAAPVPASFASRAILDDGNIVSFDGESCSLLAPNGAVLQNLGSTGAGPAFPSFVILDPTESFAVVGESSNHGLFRVNLGTGGMQAMGTVVFNFAACFESSNTIIVSAAVSGFFAPNEFVRVHTDTFAQASLGSAPGPSGPVAVNDAGDLYYLVQSPIFPTPPGSVSLVRWLAADLQGGSIDEFNWNVVLGNLDGGSSLAFDPVFGNLFFAAPVSAGSDNTIFEVDPGGQLLGPVASAGSRWCSSLQFRELSGSGAFGAFQPAGVALVYEATDFFSTHDLITVEPQRPTLTLRGPGLGGTGPVNLRVDGADPEGFVVLWRAAASSVAPSEGVFDLGLEFLVHSRLAPATIQGFLDLIAQPPARLGPFNRWYFVPDDGVLDVGFLNRPGTGGQFAFQAALLDANGRFRGTTNVAFN